MKKLFLALLLVAPVLFASCSKEETTIKGVDPFANIQFDKRLPVTANELIKYEVMRTLDNGKYEYIVFKQNVAGVLTTDLNNKPLTYVYCKQWGISGENLEFIPENGSAVTYTCNKVYTKLSDVSYSIKVYLKDKNTGKEAAYDVVDDGSNHTIAGEIWNVIETSRNQ